MKEKHTDFMIDIETLGCRPNAAVVQIGIAPFDRIKGVGLGSGFRLAIHPKSEMDDSTIRWWMQQSDQARKSVFGEEPGLEPETALRLLSIYIYETAADGFKVWAKPAAFDLVILESLYRNCGMYPPWQHWNTRCLRTLIDVSGLPKEEEAVSTIPHDARWDAHAQACTAVRCFDKLRGL